MRALGKANKMNIRVDFLEPDGSSRKKISPQTSEKSAEPEIESTEEVIELN